MNLKNKMEGSEY
jgi:hypothetical protein